jgi:integrase
VKATDVSRPDIRGLVERIADGGAPIHANRVLALLSKIFNFAVVRDWRSDNPTHGVERPGVERRRDRVLTDEEIVTLWAALNEEDPFHRALFQLRFLTAARGGEIRHMRWQELDLVTGWWTIPEEFSKNGIPHHIPLSTLAVRLLNELNAWQEKRRAEINDGRRKKRLPPRERSVWVFPSPRGGDEPFLWEQRATQRLKDKTGIEFRPHDIRRTVATALTRLQIADRFMLNQILNHVDRDITGVYDRNRYAIQKRTAMEAWCRELERILSAHQAQRGVVVHFSTPKSGEA